MEKKIEAVADDLEKTVEEKTEDATKVALIDIFGPHPTLALVKFWQGAVEVCIRIAIIVLSVAVLVAASISIRDVDIDTSDTSSHVKDLVSDGKSTAGFMVFTSLLAMIIQATIILVRFLNFGIVNRFFGAFLLIDMLVAVIVGVFYFSGGVALAVNSEEWQEQNDSWEDQGVTLNSRSKRIPVNHAVTAAFGILTIAALTVLIVWLVLFLVYNWNKHMPTTSVISGVVKGVVKEVEGSGKPKLKF